MKIALIGYGKMGKTIERIASARGHDIVAILDGPIDTWLSTVSPDTVDVVIEFSVPEAAFQNISSCLQHGLKVVSGTTGWLEKKPVVDEICRNKANAAFFYASNFSIGVNLFFRLNSFLAKLMSGQPEYSVTTTEIHHTEKKDAPSGTAITLAEGIIAAQTNKQSWTSNTLPQADEVPIWSAREGKVPGTHIIKYISDVDQIEILHQAHSREGFALGAVIAAEWIQHQTGVVGMDDMLTF